VAPIVDAVAIEGFREFRAALRAIGREAPRALRVAGNEAADLVVTRARSSMPSRSGKARASVKAKSTQTAVKIASGGNRAPYVPWLDYGGAVGRNDTARRPFIADGRYVYPAYRESKDEFEKILQRVLQRVADEAGVVLD
jgi:hypothetical protein